MAITDERDEARPTGTLGIERWVYFAYLAMGVTAAWLFSKIGEASWAMLNDSVDAVPAVNEQVVTVVTALLAIAGMVFMFKSTKINTFVHEVCVELSKVAWPSKDETWSQTRVVIMVSILAAIVLGVFDGVWSRITDLIYNV